MCLVFERSNYAVSYALVCQEGLDLIAVVIDSCILHVCLALGIRYHVDPCRDRAASIELYLYLLALVPVWMAF